MDSDGALEYAVFWVSEKNQRLEQAAIRLNEEKFVEVFKSEMKRNSMDIDAAFRGVKMQVIRQMLRRGG
jgi:hypothetical protein